MISEPARAARSRTTGRASRVATVVTASLLALVGACGSEPEPLSFDRAPIVLVDLSGLRADRLELADALRELAAESVLFEWAFTPSPHPGPARASLLTGRYPVALGLLADGGELAAETVTLAEHLAAHGYRTAAFVSAGRAATVRGIEQGFETWRQVDAAGLDAVAAPGIDWLRGVVDQPFFLYLEADGLQPGDAASPLAGLLRELEELGVAERALVVVTSDRGAAPEEPGVDGPAAAEVHASVARVPLLVRLPAGREAGLRGHREPRITDLVDVAPTVLELVGVEPVDAMQGDSLVAVLDQRGRPPYLAFTDSIEPEGEIAVAMAGYRLVLSRADDRAALYRLAEDPLELTDLAAEEPEKVAVLRRRLEEWQRTVLAGTGGADGDSADDEMLEQLRNLGYIQ